ncbi:hypothetical protein IDM40_13655 [Nocardiopsis sp. HNM0947]|uniref:Integral membrane protein n=1 Tax=Nocardiopsis coralli TaxID=2772213 RepID=A0ABR9P7D5_9ACTN|nr:hypothetical protein [Nocardiopsis coralli]MBE2999748.1 hypothetical protein [Nocardiopsis coralli]
MATKPKPGIVVATLVLLILIAAYHLVMGTFSLFGAVVGDPEQAAELLGEEPPPEWSIYLGALSMLVVGAAAVVLAVLVGKSSPSARTAVIGVNTVAAAALLVMMVTTPAFALDAIISAVFLLVTAGLMFSSGAKQHFAASPAGY